jgi:hypothetical protein
VRDFLLFAAKDLVADDAKKLKQQSIKQLVALATNCVRKAGIKFGVSLISPSTSASIFEKGRNRK